MKKILLATTMLVGTAGFAAAEVALSGDGRMGVEYNEAVVGNEMSFNSRARATVTMSGETDGGLSFGGSFGIHDAAAASGGTAGSVFISGAFGKLSMGDVSSAAENAVGDLTEIGYAGLGTGNEFTYLTTGDNEMALYTYSAGAFTGMISVGQPGNGATETYSVAAKYAADAFSVAVGYEDAGATDHAIVGATGTFGGASVEAIYGRATGNFKQYGLGVSYKIDAVTVEAYYKKTDTAGVTADFYGIGAEYDLGGGATLAGGVADLNGTTRADVGMKFKF